VTRVTTLHAFVMNACLLALHMHTLDWSLLYLHISRFRDTVLISQWPLEERVLSLAVPQTRPMVVTTVKHSIVISFCSCWGGIV
jgi:hypothetical protein